MGCPSWGLSSDMGRHEGIRSLVEQTFAYEVEARNHMGAMLLLEGSGRQQI